MRNYLPIIGLSCLFVFVAGVLGVNYLTKTKVDPVIQKSIAVETHAFGSYSEDLEYLRGADFFASSFNGMKTGQHDAGPELNAMLDWIPRLNPQVPEAKPLVPLLVKEKILRAEKAWMEHPLSFERDFKHQEFHFEFFKNLKDSDYWNIESSGPVAELIHDNRFIPPGRLPAPDGLELIMVVKARLLEALFSRTEIQALSDARELARLLFTTESFRLELAAVSILEAERVAYYHYLEAKRIKPEDWQPFDSNVTRRASRAIWATRGYLRVWTPPELLQKIFLSEQRPIGFCSAVSDGIPSEWMVKSMLGSDLPLERSYSDGYATLEKIFAVAKEHCRLAYLNQIFAHGSFKVDLPVPEVLSLMPYSRKLFGLTYSSTHFEGFSEYERPHPRAEF